ncbi:MAG: glycoside hydrolase family 97 N-terminal domain-containing protein, partial [Bacteroidetes bacterium]|nr:glycoside hydrolase family 97 N-terminal domain-containing protein [Bacteroidota bacterium]
MRSFLLLSLFLCAALSAQTITSPNKSMSLTVSMSADSVPHYTLSLGTTPVVAPSRLGIAVKDIPSFLSGFTVVKAETSLVNESWNPVLGEVKTIRNHYRELKLTLRQPSVKDRIMLLTFRLFDDGVGFRYEFPQQDNLNYFTVAGERTEFALTGDHKVFWMPGDFDTNEYKYAETNLSGVDAAAHKDRGEIFTAGITSNSMVQTPIQMKSKDGLYINIAEAALVNYPAMCLEVDTKQFLLSSV